VGSIYATDTDRFSMQGMPQVAELFAQRGSLTHSAHRALQRRTDGGPLFAAPKGGMHTLAHAVGVNIVERGGFVLLSTAVRDIARDGNGFVVQCDNQTFDADAIVLATPAKHTAPIMRSLDDEIAEQLAAVEHASVVMITLSVPRHQWPAHLTGSGYLVPKPMQTAVTAVSFGSNKWAHWQTENNEMILRISLGRDGMPLHHLDDDRLLALALADLQWHLGIDVQPTHVRTTRWVESFPQYRPGHAQRIEWLERSLAAVAPGITLAGASYRGIGIPACIASAQRAAEHTLMMLGT
jgi:oxygen-dependent protoporphyrinogen oxidase